jgi:hypothetical protein
MQEFSEPRWLRLLTNMTGIRSNLKSRVHAAVHILLKTWYFDNRFDLNQKYGFVGDVCRPFICASRY